jgi:hypothetical protein
MEAGLWPKLPDTLEELEAITDGARPFAMY